MAHVRFPSIEQFRRAIRNVQHKSQYRGLGENGEPVFDPTAIAPIVPYIGTVKLHGTNAAIHWDNGEISYQSRERVLSLTEDNHGFMLAQKQNEDLWQQMIGESLLGELGYNSHDDADVVIYGEWCGQGIANGVAICELPKMFVIFAIKIDGQWMRLDDPIFKEFKFHEDRIFNIMDFPYWTLPIDFNNPGLVQNDLITLTLRVEEECPVGKYFGVSGVGEGIVWRPVDPNRFGSDCWFKVKGEKHSVSKVKTLAPVDVELVKSQNDFLDNVITEQRLNQGLAFLRENNKPLDPTSTGDFIRWVFNDVIKEEEDTIIASQLDPKKLGGPIANRSKPWFFQYINAQNLVAA